MKIVTKSALCRIKPVVLIFPDNIRRLFWQRQLSAARRQSISILHIQT